MSTQLSREKHRWWQPNDHGGFVLRLGALTLEVDEDEGRICWCVQWDSEDARGTTATLGGAKRRALEVAKRVLWETAERLALAEGKR